MYFSAIIADQLVIRVNDILNIAEKNQIGTIIKLYAKYFGLKFQVKAGNSEFVVRHLFRQF